MSKDITPAAPFLFSEEAISAITSAATEMSASEAYTAEELQTKWPEVYQEIVRLRALNVSKRAIQRLFNLHFYTVSAVCDQQSEPIEALRLKLGRKALQLGALIMDSLEGDVISGKLKPGEKAFAINTLITQGQVLSGGATSRVEIDKPLESPFKDWLATAKPADGRVIDVPSEMGSEAGGKFPLSAGEAALVERPSEPISPDNIDSHSVGSEDVTAFDTTPPQPGGENPRSNDQGGRESDF